MDMRSRRNPCHSEVVSTLRPYIPTHTIGMHYNYAVPCLNAPLLHLLSLSFTSPHHLDILYPRTRLTLPLYSRNVLLRHCVPRAHVFLHAAGKARLFALGQRGAGLGDAALKAVFVQLLDEQASILHGSFLLDLAHDLGFASEVISLHPGKLLWAQAEGIRVIGAA
jgi:hypothetical protein